VPVDVRPLTFWFEFASSYSYPAALRIEEVSRRYGRSVVWRPFLLGPIFREQGWNDSPFNIYPAKGRYMWRDLERICAGLGLPFRRPSQFPRNGLLAARIVCTDEAGAWVPQFVRRVYTANFSEDCAIADPEVLLDRLQGLVSDPTATLAAAQTETAKSLLRRNTEQAVELGIFGSPTVVAGTELFWGNDRIEPAFEWAAGNERGD
jgi:2-hydroxychromene-2-carboxylate isomerase